jgi:glycosyltransferase involved in cell wall biosynthesis
MKLLIISSEPLNPDNILSSIFELTQASILKTIAEVCILSVSPEDTMSARLKKQLKQPWNTLYWEKEFVKNTNDNILKTLVLRANHINTYILEGIHVIEGKNYNWYSKGSYLKKLRNWISAGLSAYRYYERKYGKPDIIHAHGRFLNAGALALRIHNHKQIPFIYTEHSTSYQLGVAPRDAKPILHEIVDKASAFITVSKSLLNDFELFLGRQIPHALVMPNTMDPIFEETLKKVLNTDQFSFLNISSFHRKKGLDILLKSFKKAFSGNPYYKLTICGDGPLKDELLALQDELGLKDSVQFTGNITKQEIKKQLDASNALVVSSLHETFGVVVIEALSRGCPVVSTRCGGPEDIVDEESGILVKAGDEHELAEALKKMATDYSHYDIKKIQDRAISEYGSKAFLYSSENLYRSVLKKKATQ